MADITIELCYIYIQSDFNVFLYNVSFNDALRGYKGGLFLDRNVAIKSS